MPLVAKRKVRQTWREAVIARAGGQASDLVPRFDALVAGGLEAGAAAYRTLEGAGLLSRVDEPGAIRPAGRDADEVPAA
jgi:hypothetical protein